MKKAIVEHAHKRGIDLAYLTFALVIALIFFLIVWKIAVGASLYEIVNMTIAP